jgi:hypothetical protein
LKRQVNGHLSGGVCIAILSVADSLTSVNDSDGGGEDARWEDNAGKQPQSHVAFDLGISSGSSRFTN